MAFRDFLNKGEISPNLQDDEPIDKLDDEPEETEE